MRILYIAAKSPAPVIDGGCFAMMECLKGLSKLAEVDGIILKTYKHPYTKESERILAQYLKKQTVVPMKTEISPARALVDFIRRRNYNLSRFKSEQLYRVIAEKLHEKYDFIVCDSVFAAAQLSHFDTTGLPPVIIRSHNVESEIWKLHAAIEGSVMKRFYLRQLEKTLREEEIDILNKATVLWAISEEDKNWMLLHTQQKNIRLLPVSVDLHPEIQTDYSKDSFFHLGSMNWKPNQEAVQFLVRKIWSDPAIAPFKLFIAGSKSEHFKFYNSDSIEVIGWVENSSVFMSQAGALITPILSGSGIRIKLLEAMALGVPCITTTLGATGIDIKNSGIQIADSPESFVEIVLKLHGNAGLRQELGEKSRNYISKVHSFETGIAVMKETLEG
jgi:glycosyltransferase involved in cell wall biosynthesis